LYAIGTIGVGDSSGNLMSYLGKTDGQINGQTIWTRGNMGSNSGLNADLLDGYDWTSGQEVWFGIGHFQTPNIGTTGGIKIKSNPSHGNAILQFTDSNETTQYGFIHVASDGKLNYSNNQVWTAGNQGSGTGMNADMVDGYHYSDIISAASGSSGSNSNGYWERRPSGIIEQWGTNTANDPSLSSVVTHTFPIAFSDVNSIAINVTSKYPNNSAVDGNSVNGQALSSTTFQLTSDDHDKTVYWRAIGR
jgi:hypothetical protein